MRRKILTRTIITISIGLFIACLVVIKTTHGYSDKVEDEEGVKSENRTFVRDGITYVILDSVTMSRNGIELTRLSARMGRVALVLYGSVIVPESILNDASDFSSARGAYESATSRRAVSEKELQRLKTLNENKSVSDKVLEEANSQYVLDKNGEATALRNLELIKARIVLKWGDRISNWIFKNDSILSRLIKGEFELIEVGVPMTDTLIKKYQTALITTPSGSNIKARFLGFSGVADPVFQGRALFFLARSLNQELVPGMNVVAHVFSGSARAGVLVPKSAIVWYKSLPWVYYEKAPGEFSRVMISTELPQFDGYLVTGTLKSGDVIISKGAQLLLSEEFKSQIKVED